MVCLSSSPYEVGCLTSVQRSREGSVRAPLGALPLLGLCGSMALGQLLKLSRGGFRTLRTPEWLMQRGLGLLSDPTIPL